MSVTIQIVNTETRQTRHIAVDPAQTNEQQLAYARRFLGPNEETNGTYVWS
jgi:hypothetical protein